MKTKKQKRLSRITALILCVSMLVTSMPVMAFAETADAAAAAAEAAQNEVTEEPSVTEDVSAEAQPVPVSEIDDLRSETVKHFLNEDGSFTAVNYMTAVHYQREGESAWTEIDNSLSEVQAKSADGETKYIPQDSPIDVQITDSSDSTALVRLASGEHRISWSYESLKKSKAEKKPKKEKKDKATKDKESEMAEACFPEELSENLTDGLVYENIAESTDLEIVLSGKNLKENLILKDKHAQTDYVIRYDIGSLTAEQKDEHTILLKDNEKEVFNIHAPYMNDAAGTSSDGVEVSILSQEEGILRVSLTADKAWVKAEERVYPIVVDPYVIEATTNINQDAAAIQYDQGSSLYPHGTLLAGKDGGILGKAKSYVQFELPKLKPGDMVTGGELYLYQYGGTMGYDTVNVTKTQINAHRVLEDWTDADVIYEAYSSAPEHHENVVDYVSFSSKSSFTACYFDISRLVKDWYKNTNTNRGVCLEADNPDAVAMVKFVSTDNTDYPQYRPFMTVRYLNNKGLENRWTYHEQSLGESGSGFVNDCTGNLVFTVPLAATNGELMSASVSLVYNGYQQGKKVDQIVSCGEGWRLNIQQRIIKLEEDNTGYGSSINSLYDSLYAAGYRYIYEDADGTDHYFVQKENSTTKFIDEEGLGLELSAVTGSTDTLEETKIVSDDGSKLTFTSRGYLRAAYDSEGNQYKLYYSTETPGAVTSVEDGAGKKITLSRNANNRLSKVTDPAGREITLAYYEGGGLYTVTYPDATTVGMAYDSSEKLIRVKGRDGIRLRYTYPASGDHVDKAVDSRVIKIEEFGTGAGSACNEDYLGQSLDIFYGKNRTVFTDSDGLRQVYQFDNYGRTTGINDSEGGYRSFTYINPSASDSVEASQKAHLVSSTASASQYVENLLKDHSFERSPETSFLWTGAEPHYNDVSYLGDVCAKIWASDDTVSQKYETSSGTYTFSAYVKTTSAAAYPKLSVTFYQSDGTELDTIETPARKNQLNWARMHISFTVPSGTAYIRVRCGKDGTDGTAYFDCLQLESGNVMNRYNMVENSDFDRELTGTWTEVNTVSADKRKTDNGNYYYLTGEGTKTKRLYQKIEVNRDAENLYFAVSGLGEAFSVPKTSTDKRFALVVRIYFGDHDGTYVDKIIRFNQDYTGSQYVAGVAGCGSANQTNFVDYIEVRCVYNYNENAAKFDKIQVTLDESGTSYTYDSKGNLTTASDNAGRKQGFTYNEAEEVLTAAANKDSADEKNYEYKYDQTNKHRLVSAISKSSDIGFSYGYNDRGRVKEWKVQAVNSEGNGTGDYIKTDRTYTNSRNYVLKERDVRGKAYSYVWDDEEKKGLLKSVEDPSGRVTSYEYAANDDYLTKATMDETSVTYDYTAGNLLKKISSPKTTYSFSYDSFGNVTKSAIGSNPDAANAVTLAQNTYNNHNGNLQKSVYGNGFTIGYSYDKYDRVTAVLHGEEEKFKWSYGADGQVGRHEDKINGKNYQYTYDLAGRLLRTDISDGSSIRMTYNSISLPTGLHYTVAGTGSRNVYYTYADRDNLPKKTSFGTGSAYSAENTYDGLGRLNYVKYETPSDSVNAIKADYNYLDVSSDPDRTTDIVNNIKYTYTSGQLGALERFYVYGAAGNITEEYTGSDTTGELKEKYGYDDKGQLVRHYSARQNKTFVYEYNDAGNITAKKTYPYVTTLSELNAIIDNPQDTVLYEYSQGVWGDLLEKYDGNNITSDSIGNITSWDGKTFTWNGRQLASYAKNGTTTSYKYNADGIRTQKKSGTVTTDYFLNGSQILMQQTKEGDTVKETMWFFYDNQGNRIGLCRDGDYFYYLYNVQGDVLALVDAETGKIAANYQYGAWGEKTSVKTAEGYGDLGTANPFRYRGYYWDEESGLYYLNSRYYSPELCRFISADSQINGDILGTNLFAYCGNNPVNCIDTAGHALDFILDIGFAGYSLWEACKDPSPATWGAFLLDVACIVIPFATGGGALARAGAKYGDDVLAAAKTGDNVADAGKSLNRIENAGNAAYDAGRAGGNVSAGGGLCFVKDTLILTEEGLEEIQFVKEGDNVWAENPETGEKSLKRVAQTFVNETDELVHVYAGSEKISATPEHPFYVRDRGWTGAIDLRAGDILVLQDGGYVIVEKIQHEILEKPVTVYNFEVEDFHTYYVGADSVLAHNRCLVEQSGVKVEVRTSNEHGLPHAHVSGNGPNTTIGLDQKPMKNHPDFSKKQRKVIQANWEVIKNGIIELFPRK